MLKKFILACLAWGLCNQTHLVAHCQMPCGIYHDEMVFDEIDQYVETMVKCISVIEDNKFTTIQDRNTVIRWVMEKECLSDEMADIFTTYFLQQKIKPGEADTAKKVLSAHKLLFLLVGIKQTVDLKIVNDFYQEWESFKLMFHIEGYKCKVSQAKLKNWQERQEAIKQGKPVPPAIPDHDHDHDDHNHTH